MARRKLAHRNVRSLTKTGGGNAYSLTLPIEYIRTLKWQKRQKVTVTLKGKQIIIEDWDE